LEFANWIDQWNSIIPEKDELQRSLVTLLLTASEERGFPLVCSRIDSWTNSSRVVI
jgi:hypothetical protein